MPNNVIYGNCLSCRKNQKHRGGRNYWSCRYCGAKNPGPELMRPVFENMTGGAPAADEKAKRAVKQKPAEPQNGHTQIVSGARKPVAAGAVKKGPAAAPKKPAAPPSAARTKTRSLLSKAFHG